MAFTASKLISFDIDGTLEVGDPPGSVTMDIVRRAKELGYFIGSCSDRTISNQQRLWERHGIEVDFTVLKHQIGVAKHRFQADEYYHIGDSELDRYYSEKAGFRYLPPDFDLELLLDGHSPV